MEDDAQKHDSLAPSVLADTIDDPEDELTGQIAEIMQIQETLEVRKTEEAVTGDEDGGTTTTQTLKTTTSILMRISTTEQFIIHLLCHLMF